MSRSLYRALLTLLVVFGLGCAEGTVENPGADAGNTDIDVGNNTTSNNMTTPVEDMGPTEDMNPCGLCCPGERTCLDGMTAGVCNDDGSNFDAVPCEMGDTCSGAGVCTTPPVCTAGEKSCFDDATVLTCRATEDGYTTSPCEMGTVCFDGVCVTGAATGTPCNNDDECASGQCHCGSGTDENCPSTATPGYCTKPCTTDEDCGADAYCVVGDLAPLGVPSANYNHCASTCEAICGEPSLGCIEVPHNTPEGEVLWDDTCYFDGIVEIGQPCTSDDQCIGECMESYVDGGYCSRRCDNDGVCPDGAACVELRTGEFWCSLLCGDGSIVGNPGECPRDVPVDNFSITCKNLNGLENNRVFRVCAATSG